MITMRQKKSGQGMTEYIIIVVLVAIAVLIGVKTFGGVVRTKFNGSTTTIDDQLKTDVGGGNGGGSGRTGGGGEVF